MATEKTQAARSGISTTSLLGVLFVGLKLGGVIHWSWWWVTMPFWLGAAFLVVILIGVLVFAGGCFAVAGFCEIMESRARRHNERLLREARR